MSLTASLADEAERVRCCYYGEWGTGKTTAAAHAAKLGPVKHVDAELRLKPGPLRRLGVPVDQIDPFRDVDFHNLRGLIENMREDIHDADTWDEAEDNDTSPTRWQALIHDSVTEIGQTMLTHVLEANVTDARNRAAKRGEVVTINPYEINIDYWGEMVEQYRRLLRDMRNLDCHLIFTAQERRDVDKNDGSVRIGPGTTPALQSALMGYCDVVIHTYRQGKYHLGLTEPGTKYLAKDSFGLLPPVMVNPTFDRVVRYVQEDLTIDTDPVQQTWMEEMSALAETAAVAATEDTGTTRRRRGRT